MGLLDMFSGMNNYGVQADPEMKKRAQMASLGSLANGLLQAGFAGNSWDGFGKGVAGGIQGMGDAYKNSLLEDEEMNFKRGQRAYQMDAQADEKKTRKEKIAEDDALDKWHATAVPALQEEAAEIEQQIMSNPNLTDSQKTNLTSRGKFLLDRAIKSAHRGEDGSIKFVPKAVEDLDAFINEAGGTMGDIDFKFKLEDRATNRTIFNNGYGKEDPNGLFDGGDGKRYNVDIEAFNEARKARDQSVIDNNEANADLKRARTAWGPSSGGRPSSSADGQATDTAMASIRKSVNEELSSIINADKDKQGKIKDERLRALSLKRGFGANGPSPTSAFYKKWKTDRAGLIEEVAMGELKILYPEQKARPVNTEEPVTPEPEKKTPPTTVQLAAAIKVKGKEAVILKLMNDYGLSRKDAAKIVDDNE